MSKRKSEEANRADYHEWSVSEQLKPHPNVLGIIGICPSFQHPHYASCGTTALISAWQENSSLRSFYDRRALWSCCFILFFIKSPVSFDPREKKSDYFGNREDIFFKFLVYNLARFDSCTSSYTLTRFLRPYKLVWLRCTS